MDIFCASPASTAICSSIDQRSMIRHSHKTIINEHDHDHQQSPRYNLLDHQIHHHRRIKNHHVPCSSQLPINPRPSNNYNYEKSRKSTTCSDNFYCYNKQTSEQVRRKSSADIYDLKKISSRSPPAGNSSRYLLSDTPFIDWLSSTENNTTDHVQQRVVSDLDQPAKVKFRSLSTKESTSSSLRTSSFARSRHQVVVLRVSLHCKGCEGKVRKHLSKLEGVTSFSIDFSAKKVTVVGDITPLGVLASVSKVKNAQLWPSPTSSSPSSPWSA